MNLIKELLERCRYEDGIKPEFDRHQMAAEVASMPDALFDGLMEELKIAALVKNLMGENKIDFKSRGQGVSALVR